MQKKKKVNAARNFLESYLINHKQLCGGYKKKYKMMCVRLCALAGLASMRTRARARASLSANLYLWLLAYSIYMHHICTKVH